MDNLTSFKEKLKSGQDLTINFVGDSITHGLNVCGIEETYVAKFTYFLGKQFENYTVYRYDGVVKTELLPLERFDGPILISKGKGEYKIDVIKNGVGGNTAVRAYKRIDDFTGILPNGKEPDVTFMMFGINDALKIDPDKYVDAATFKNNYKILIDEVRRRNPETLIILMTATTSNITIEEHCERTLEIAEEEGFPCIDLHKLWSDHYDENTENWGHGDWLIADPWHPTPKGAEIMAKYILDEFMKIIA